MSVQPLCDLHRRAIAHYRLHPVRDEPVLFVEQVVQGEVHDDPVHLDHLLVFEDVTEVELVVVRHGRSQFLGWPIRRRATLEHAESQSPHCAVAQCAASEGVGNV